MAEILQVYALSSLTLISGFILGIKSTKDWLGDILIPKDAYRNFSD